MSGGGALSRLAARVSWALFKRERVGMDELGNVYIRKLERNPEGEEVEKRFVKYKGDPEPVGLPAEWHQWLHRARTDPPTEEDIRRGQHQRELFKKRVAAIEAEDAARRFQEATGGGGGGGVRHQLGEGGTHGSSGGTA
ncbi:NADH:ubiquinone oxidoreductase family isoform B [Micractinium conductrix]|uniref:NADH:ubiquinone oxidoreductase family isoform A n=1 Tax=Micractinium conductrix TaxID=554055 RepID=A0A2P6VE26_9CHLO|nr:NADH:ubiquinone oxidoreductase family isoform A [Micractinium conductrix]PSC72343.1 NADH:ubiquinone oxidoreductase family isoform B [Micractinium conductrix]|eukprot:PSC72342.1 NADH:ubiquinone oxidoreductase family isoform A [Micractinium conductrix]